MLLLQSIVGTRLDEQIGSLLIRKQLAAAAAAAADAAATVTSATAASGGRCPPVRLIIRIRRYNGREEFLLKV